MYKIIGAVCGWGAQIRECEQGSSILKEFGLFEKLKEENFSIREWETLYASVLAKDTDIPLDKVLPVLSEFNLKLSHSVEKTLDGGDFPIILGGGHTIAVGTWSGAYQHFKKKNALPMGLIWVDAHMDCHTPETSHSGAWHGMPLAALMGYGDPKMAKLRQEEAILLPENLCFVGIRSYEEGEKKLVEKLGIKVFYADDCHKRGTRVVMKEAIEHVTKNTNSFGVSLDLDVIDPKEAPGVGSPEKGGLLVKELLEGLKLLPSYETFKAFELVEYNPKRNHHEMTAKVCHQILNTVLKKGK